MIKIVFDARMIDNSGIGTYIKELLPNLCSKYEVVLIGNKSKIIGILDVSINYTVIEFNIPIYSIKEQLFFPFIVPNCDVFISPHFNTTILPIRAKKRISFIADVFHLAFYDSLSLSQKIYAKILIKNTLRVSERVITISEFSKQEIIKYTKCNSRKIDVIKLGVDRNLFKKVDNDTLLQNVKNKYQLPKLFMLYVGNVKPHKNLKGLLKAFISNSEIYNNIKLVIVGKKAGFLTGDSELFELIKSNEILQENVLFTGFVDNQDLSSVYSLANFFVFPSLYEGFGLPPLEAMACGIPTIVSNQASIPEVCKEASIYFNPKDEQDIANAIVQVLNDAELRKNLVSKGNKLIDEYNWDNTFSQLKSIIDKV